MIRDNEAPSEDLAEATITLAIRTQATLIEHQLALKKIFLDRAGRCLPQVLAGRANASQGERLQHEPHKLCVPGSTPGPAPFAPDECGRPSEASVHSSATNPNAAAFSQVHISGGGRW